LPSDFGVDQGIKLKYGGHIRPPSDVVGRGGNRKIVVGGRKSGEMGQSGGKVWEKNGGLGGSMKRARVHEDPFSEKTGKHTQGKKGKPTLIEEDVKIKEGA